MRCAKKYGDTWEKYLKARRGRKIEQLEGVLVGFWNASVIFTRVFIGFLEEGGRKVDIV